MEKSGHSKAQSIAAALDTARRAGAKVPQKKQRKEIMKKSEMSCKAAPGAKGMKKDAPKKGKKK